MNQSNWYRLWMLGCFLVILIASPVRAQESQPQILLLNANGALTSAMAGYLERGIQTAENKNAEAIILELNTPGGDISLMNRMIQDIRASRVPVIVYVAPNGAMAASAGSLITMAGHVAAMAPETSIGAASPVGPSGQDLAQTEALKQKEILKATARSLTERRGPQAISLAQDMIENAKAVSATQALDAGLIDFIATDVNDLLRQADGMQVSTAAGTQTLHTAQASVVPLPATFIENLLAALTDPNIVLLLLNIGVIAILIEISNPGGWIPGFIGVVCLALAVYGLDLLPVNWFGLIFIVLAFGLFVLDIKAPTHGALTLAGVGSLIIGALVLFNSSNVPGVQRASVPLVIGTSIMTGALFFGILLFALRAQKVPIRTGQESMLGRTGIVTVDLNPRGHVQVAGELWTAELADGSEPLPRGTRVAVVGVKGVRLLVQKIGESRTISSIEN
jgi:membrane-bound serine protease (ClpP class)